MSWVTLIIIVAILLLIFGDSGSRSTSRTKQDDWCDIKPPPVCKPSNSQNLKTGKERAQQTNPLHEIFKQPEKYKIYSVLKDNNAIALKNKDGQQNPLSELIKKEISPRQDQIRHFVNERKIEHLVHFTRIENLPSILEHGLITRESILAGNITSIFNDKHRYDGVENSVSTSISFPNYKMFYSLRMKNNDTDWVVLKLRPSVLWEIDCAFCVTNAAASSVSSIPIHQRQGVNSLRQMFISSDNYQTRELLGLPDSFPTDPQAEVLFLETIGPEYIAEVCLNERSKIKNFQMVSDIIRQYSDNINFIYDKTLFYPRADFAYWKNMDNK